MSGWALGLEVRGSELVVARIDDSDRLGRATLLDEPSAGAEADPSGSPVDATAVRLAAAAHTGGGQPARLVVVTPSDTAIRRFEELSEAAALAGLPAPYWLPTPVALAGAALTRAVPVGGAAMVIDARESEVVAWPVWRTPEGAEVGGSGPIATGTRLDQLLTGVARAKLRAVSPALAAKVDDDADPTGRAEAARLRRELRKARRRLAESDVEQVTLPASAAGGPAVVLERAVFAQLVDHALRETMHAIHAAHPVAATVVVAHRRTPLAVALAERTGGDIVRADSTDSVLSGAAALVAPALMPSVPGEDPSPDPPVSEPPVSEPSAPEPSGPEPSVPVGGTPVPTGDDGDGRFAGDAWPDAWAGAWSSARPAGDQLPPPDRGEPGPPVARHGGGVAWADAPLAEPRPTGVHLSTGDAAWVGEPAAGPARHDLVRVAAPVRGAGGPAGPRHDGIYAPVPAWPGPPAVTSPGHDPRAGGVPFAVVPRPADRRAGGVRPVPAPAPASAPSRALVPATPPPVARRRRPRWAVPALSAVLVVVVIGAIGVLVLGPRFASDPRSGPAAPPPVATPAAPAASSAAVPAPSSPSPVVPPPVRPGAPAGPGPRPAAGASAP